MMTERDPGRGLCALLAAVSLALAPEALALGDAEESVVTPTRTEVPRGQIASPVTVITAEELRERQVRFVSDALRAVPGVEVSRTGGVGGLTSVRIRGGEANHTMVLLDGMQVNDPIGGGYDFGNLMVDDIERIEIVRGPQSVLYGGDAASGVIHIVTRRGHRGLSGSGRYEHGSRNTNGGWGTLAGGTERTRFSLSGHTYATRGISHADRDRGFHDEDEFRDGSVGATFDLFPTNEFDLGGSVKWIGSRIDFDGFPPPDFVLGDRDNRTRLRQFFGNGFVKLRLWEDRVRPQLRVSYTDTDRDNYDRDLPGNPKTSSSNGERIQIDFQTEVAMNESTQLVVGVDSKRESAETDAVDDDVWTTGYFGEAQYAWTNRLFLTAGARIDDHEGFGTHGSYRLTGAYNLGSTTRIKATWGTGFAAPSLLDLYFDSAFFVGNPGLDAERTKSWDVGLEQELFGGFARLGVTYFETHTKDLIVFVGAPFPEPGTVENVDESTARGIEATLFSRPVDELTIHGAYTYLRTRDSQTHDSLPRRPYHVASLNANYRPVSRLGINLAIYYNGRAEDARSFSPDRGQKLDGYTIVHLGLSFDVSERLRVFGRVENLFDDDYQEVTSYGSVGRSYYGGAELRF